MPDIGILMPAGPSGRDISDSSSSWGALHGVMTCSAISSRTSAAWDLFEKLPVSRLHQAIEECQTSCHQDLDMGETSSGSSAGAAADGPSLGVDCEYPTGRRSWENTSSRSGNGGCHAVRSSDIQLSQSASSICCLGGRKRAGCLREWLDPHRTRPLSTAPALAIFILLAATARATSPPGCKPYVLAPSIASKCQLLWDAPTCTL